MRIRCSEDLVQCGFVLVTQEAFKNGDFTVVRYYNFLLLPVQ